MHRPVVLRISSDATKAAGGVRRARVTAAAVAGGAAVSAALGRRSRPRRVPAGSHVCGHPSAKTRPVRCLQKGFEAMSEKKRSHEGPVSALRLARDQTEKLDPQPHVVVAFGFLITNC